MKETTKHILSFRFLFVLLTFLFAFSEKLLSQKYIEDFKIRSQKKIISSSKYSTIDFIDSRLDTIDLGFVYSGPENKIVQVLPKIGFKKQLKTLLEKSIDSTSGKGELLFQLRKFKFLETAEANVEFGFCLLRADLYLKQDGKYKKLDRIDTIVIVESRDATMPIFEETSNALTDFIFKNLTQAASNTQNYSYNSLVKIDSLEKSKIKLYNVIEYMNGVYNTFEAFKNQTPDYKLMQVVYKKEKLTALKIENKKGKKYKIKPATFFVFVHEGKPYISAEFGCYPLEKINNDFYFNGEGKIPKEVIAMPSDTNSEEANETKNEIASEDQIGVYQIRIDHIDGSLMRIKQIK